MCKKLKAWFVFEIFAFKEVLEAARHRSDNMLWFLRSADRFFVSTETMVPQLDPIQTCVVPHTFRAVEKSKDLFVELFSSKAPIFNKVLRTCDTNSKAWEYKVVIIYDNKKRYRIALVKDGVGKLVGIPRMPEIGVKHDG